MGTDSSLFDDRSIDAALERLRRDLFVARTHGTHPDVQTIAAPEPEFEADSGEAIDFASLEFEVERMRKRLAIWEIFMTYIRHGARNWPDVQRSLTKDDFNKIALICDGVPLRDLLLDMR